METNHPRNEKKIEKKIALKSRIVVRPNLFFLVTFIWINVVVYVGSFKSLEVVLALFLVCLGLYTFA